MANFFWNGSESRPRAVWRLLGQVVLMIGLLVVGGIVFQSIPSSALRQGLVTLVGIGGSVLLAARWFDRRDLHGLGLWNDRRWWIDFTFGCALGIALMGLIFGVENLAGWVSVETLFAAEGNFLLPFLAHVFLMLCVGVTEELWMRGYLIPNFAEGLSSRTVGRRTAVIAALVLSSVIFGALHVANPNASLVSTTGVIFAGLVLGLPFVWTGSLAIPIGLHFTWNASQGLIFGYPVSGMTGFPRVFEIERDGPRWLSGGEFGPEAGMLSVAALVLGAATIYAWLRSRESRPRIQAALADPPIEQTPLRDRPGEA